MRATVRQFRRPPVHVCKESEGSRDLRTCSSPFTERVGRNFAGPFSAAHAAQIMKMVGRTVFFDSSTPQGLTHIHMTALMRCVRCAARLQHMVAHRACRDIAAEIMHSALSMRSRLGLLQEVKI